jgi:hypothetical protein
MGLPQNEGGFYVTRVCQQSLEVRFCIAAFLPNVFNDI